MTRRPLRFAGDERGAIAVFAAVIFPLFILILGLVIDFSRAAVTKNELQIAADASALAGAISLEESDATVRAYANSFAEHNMPFVNHGDVLLDTDIDIGNWNAATRLFTPGGTPRNAVRTATRREGGNAMAATGFSALAGVVSWNLTAHAVAVAGGSGDDCYGNGFVAMGKVYSGSQNSFQDGFCIHGEQGVKVGSQNDIGAGVEISMPDLSDLEQGSDNPGLPAAVEERSMDAPDALRIDEILADIRDGNGPWPSYLTSGPITVGSLPGTPVPGTLYYVTGDVDFGSNVTVENIGVIATGVVKTGSDVVIRNALLTSFDKVELSSNVTVGDNNFCTTGDGTVFIAAKNLVKTGSNVDITGAQLISGDLVDMGSDLVNYTSVGVQAGGDIKIGSQLDLKGCPVKQDNHLLLVSGDLSVRLVD